LLLGPFAAAFARATDFLVPFLATILPHSFFGLSFGPP